MTSTQPMFNRPNAPKGSGSISYRPTPQQHAQRQWSNAWGNSRRYQGRGQGGAQRVHINGWSKEHIKDEDLEIDVEYYPKLEGLPKDAFKKLEEECEFAEHEILYWGKPTKIPRLQVAYGDPGITYEFSQARVETKPWVPILLEIKKLVEEATKKEFNFVLCNKYNDGNHHIAEHRDDEKELTGDAPIVGVSFGQARDFVLRHEMFIKKRNKPPPTPAPINGKMPCNYSITLQSGSCVIMNPPTNSRWYHSVPKRSTRVAYNPRISLTFRKMRKDIPLTKKQKKALRKKLLAEQGPVPKKPKAKRNNFRPYPRRGYGGSSYGYGGSSYGRGYRSRSPRRSRRSRSPRRRSPSPRRKKRSPSPRRRSRSPRRRSPSPRRRSPSPRRRKTSNSRDRKGSPPRKRSSSRGRQNSPRKRSFSPPPRKRSTSRGRKSSPPPRKRSSSRGRKSSPPPRKRSSSRGRKNSPPPRKRSSSRGRRSPRRQRSSSRNRRNSRSRSHGRRRD